MGGFHVIPKILITEHLYLDNVLNFLFQTVSVCQNFLLFKEKFLKNLMKEKDQGVELVISYRDVLIKRRTVY